MELDPKSQIRSREGFVNFCKEVTQSYLEEHQLLISYLRERQPNVSLSDLSTHQIEVLTDYMNLFSANNKQFSHIQEALGDDRFANRTQFVKAFNAVRAHWLARQSPIVGAVVAFRTGVSQGDVNIGWSLDRNASKHMLVRSAIKNSINVREAMLKLANSKVNTDEYPKGVRSSLENMAHRADRIYNRKKESIAS